MTHELKPYAISDSSTKRRHHEESNLNKYRSNFGQDRDRIIESNAFRRLQYKTQVFVNFHGDHYRTRLTHSLEVGQIARWVASGLSLNKDLAEIVSLTHDLGHPPFGHAGEDMLNQKIKQHNSDNIPFSHNAQAIKIVTQIENRFVTHKGLNLCYDTLEGLAKHNGRFSQSQQIHPIITSYNQRFDLDLYRQPSLEAQISALSDDIAYNNHDMEDGIKDGLFMIEDLMEIDLILEIYQNIASKFNNLKQGQIIGEIKKTLTSRMVIDLIENSQRNLRKNNIQNLEDVRNFPDFLIQHSDRMNRTIAQLSKFLYKNMYHHEKVKEMRSKSNRIIALLFDYYMHFPFQIPDKFQSEEQDTVVSVTDFISGMTDRYALIKYEEIIKHGK